MTTARHIVTLLKSHIAGDEDRFLSTAMQLAAHEARQGHGKLAQELKDLIDSAKSRDAGIAKSARPVPLAQPKGELAGLLHARYPDLRLTDMALPDSLRHRLQRVLGEQRQQVSLREHGLMPRRKLLLVGPPGSGKTMTASALAGELHLPLFTIVLDGLITKFMGETAGKLRLVFDAIQTTRGVYFFDEFDAIGARRGERQDVGEIRRVLNSFLQFLEQEDSQSLIIAATNHPELLDRALFRRFDDVMEYVVPDRPLIEALLRTRLDRFDTRGLAWNEAITQAEKLSQAEITRAADDAAKTIILRGGKRITTEAVLDALAERRQASLSD
ncbi:ATP-binding protein (plasmid) [Methylocystis sp. MJC1]|uniref:AAA family ATPase n=1 Tax=Methylocystis sp. MJC1 TaxID=2654282 RepID=UPI0013E9D052|nr:ATP-binding protein [Methylocystis sp. MJC1]KAF2989330.1 ATP-dependent zinc metalloprotease FtsH [Methylocystis sp. MJC1]MBU6529359.1 ATP-binding protein [Methylocystis sp. MJC1]UZX14218.1 ATP-binding protein [Methylocystis sp. MJC1]